MCMCNSKASVSGLVELGRTGHCIHIDMHANKSSEHVHNLRSSDSPGIGLHGNQKYYIVRCSGCCQLFYLSGKETRRERAKGISRHALSHIMSRVNTLVQLNKDTNVLAGRCSVNSTLLFEFQSQDREREKEELKYILLACCVDP